MNTLTLSACPMPFKKWDGRPLGGCVVYIITKADQVIYVGSTNNLYLRQYDARRERIMKKADAVWYLATNTRGEAYDCEFWLIQQLKPRFNALKPSWRQDACPYPPFFSYGIKQEVAA